MSSIRSLSDATTLVRFVRNVGEGIYITTRDGRILDANPAFLAMLGVASLEELEALSTDVLVDPARRAEELAILERDGQVREFELELRCADGRSRTALDTAYQVEDPETGEVVYHGILVDITERKDLERRLRDMAVRDPLTGCFNRYHLADLERRVDRSDRSLGAVIVDIDRFKQYNDRNGHLAGDQMLVRLARLLARFARPDDALIRLGGDQFLLVLVGGAEQATPECAERLRELGPEAPIPFTLGFAVRRPDEKLERTIRRANEALIVARGRRVEAAGDTLEESRG